MLAGSAKVADLYRSKPTAVDVLCYKEDEKVRQQLLLLDFYAAAVEDSGLWKNMMTIASSCFFGFTIEFLNKIVFKVSQCFV